VRRRGYQPDPPRKYQWTIVICRLSKEQPIHDEAAPAVVGNRQRLHGAKCPEGFLGDSQAVRISEPLLVIRAVRRGVVEASDATLSKF
jgi:hypothetical protein